MARLETKIWPTADGFSGLSRRDRQGGPYKAYIPDHVSGRSFMLRGDDMADAADAERAIVGLEKSAVPLANTEALARLLLRAESVASSRIEGLVVGARRLLAADLSQRDGEETTDSTAAEVLANIDAMHFAIDAVDVSATISPELMLEAHRRLMETGDLSRYGGRLRTEQNWIGGSSYNPCSAAFVPPPPELVDELFGDLCAFCNEDSLPAIVQAAIAHAQFETIHPFVDGNGRTGRALIYMVLRRRGLVKAIIPPISLVLATEARAYIEHLNSARYVGAPDSADATEGVSRWVGMFASACVRAVADARAFEARIEAIRAEWRERIGPTRSDAAVLRMIDMLPGSPVTSIAAASRFLGRSTQTATEAIRRLVEAKILYPMRSGRQRGQIFEARDAIAAFTALERQLASPARDTQVAAPIRPVPFRK